MSKRRGRDIAWGFFSTSYSGERTLWWSMTKTRKEMERTRAMHFHATMSPGPIFRIVPPAAGKKRGGR